MRSQTELLERALRTLREPARAIESAVGLDPGGEPPGGTR